MEDCNIYNIYFSFRMESQRLGRLMLDTPMSPQDTALWWIEYVAKHKSVDHLKPKVLSRTSFWKLHMYDVFIFVEMCLIGFMSFVFWCFKRRFSSSKKMSGPDRGIEPVKKKIN